MSIEREGPRTSGQILPDAKGFTNVVLRPTVHHRPRKSACGKLHQLAWPSGRLTPHLEGPLRRRPTVAEVLAYRLVEDQKGSESRGRVGLHSPAGVWGRAWVLGWPDSFRYLPITLATRDSQGSRL